MSILQNLQATLRVLGDETRFTIIRLLLESNLCVTALSRYLGISPAAVSQHMKVLKEAGLVEGVKVGYWTHYRVNRQALLEAASELRELAVQNPCGGKMCGRLLGGKADQGGFSRRDGSYSVCSCCASIRSSEGDDI